MCRLVNTLQARECRHRRRDGASERDPSSKNLRFSTVRKAPIGAFYIAFMVSAEYAQMLEQNFQSHSD